MPTVTHRNPLGSVRLAPLHPSRRSSPTSSHTPSATPPPWLPNTATNVAALNVEPLGNHNQLASGVLALLLALSATLYLTWPRQRRARRR